MQAAALRRTPRLPRYPRGVAGAISGVIDQRNGYGDAIVMDPASPSAPISAVAVQSSPNATDDALVDVYMAP